MQNETTSENKVVKNAAWIIGVRIVQSVLALIISMLTARFLGPSNFGLINYAASVVAFVVPVTKLGLNSILVHELIHDEEKEGEILGTTLFSCFCSGCLCIIGVLAFTSIANTSETETIIVTGLYSLMLLAQALEMLMYWFQSKLLSKYTSLISFTAYVVVSVYKTFLLLTGQSIRWFALSNMLDYLLIALFQFIMYKKLGGQPLSVSWTRFKQLFSVSKYYILSGMMIAVFSQTDRVMLKLMIGNDATGFYSAAVACAGLTGFVFVALIDSASPLLYSSKKNSQLLFEQNIKRLYSVVIYAALIQSVFFTVFAKLIIFLLYGAPYAPAVPALQIVVWYTTFSYIGAVRNRWILAEGKQSYIWKIDVSGAIANILLNYLLIPKFGINGAAVASLITQFFTNVVMGLILKEIRENNKLMLQSLNPHILFALLQHLLHKHS